MTARDIMSSDVHCCSEATNVQEAAQMMLQYNVGAIPVCNQQRQLRGIITDRDLCLRVLAVGRDFQTPVSEVMSRNVQTCHADCELDQVEQILSDNQVRRLPVVDDDNRLQGFISLADLARHCQSRQEEHELAGVLASISSPAVGSPT